MAIDRTNRSVISQSLQSKPFVCPLNDDDDDSDALTPLQNARRGGAPCVFATRTARMGGSEGGNREIFYCSLPTMKERHAQTEGQGGMLKANGITDVIATG